MFAGTPLTEEDSDALEKLLLDNKISLTGERTYETVVHHLRELGHGKLAANLRANLDKGGYSASSLESRLPQMCEWLYLNVYIF